jgi:hypothetical protein
MASPSKDIAALISSDDVSDLARVSMGAIDVLFHYERLESKLNVTIFHAGKTGRMESVLHKFSVAPPKGLVACVTPLHFRIACLHSLYLRRLGDSKSVRVVLNLDAFDMVADHGIAFSDRFRHHVMRISKEDSREQFRACERPAFMQMEYDEGLPWPRAALIYEKMKTPYSRYGVQGSLSDYATPIEWFPAKIDRPIAEVFLKYTDENMRQEECKVEEENSPESDVCRKSVVANVKLPLPLSSVDHGAMYGYMNSVIPLAMEFAGITRSEGMKLQFLMPSDVKITACREDFDGEQQQQQKQQQLPEITFTIAGQLNGMCEFLERFKPAMEPIDRERFTRILGAAIAILAQAKGNSIYRDEDWDFMMRTMARSMTVLSTKKCI